MFSYIETQVFKSCLIKTTTNKCTTIFDNYKNNELEKLELYFF